MVSAVVASPSGHRHCAWPPLSAAWCWECSAMTDWQIVWLDHQHAKEVS